MANRLLDAGGFAARLPSTRFMSLPAPDDVRAGRLALGGDGGLDQKKNGLDLTLLATAAFARTQGFRQRSTSLRTFHAFQIGRAFIVASGFIAPG